MQTPSPPSPRTEVRRKSDRADYDRATIEAIVDEALICTIAFQHGGSVHCLPTSCWRTGDHLYIHGANNSRMAQALLAGECSVCIAHLDGLVLARSAFHHSMNFRSVVIYGRFEEVVDPDYKLAAFNAFVDFVSPGRSTLVREPSAAEISGTKLLRISLHEAAAKMRSGGVIDADDDMAVPVWAGVVPLAFRAGEPERDAACRNDALPSLPIFLKP
jgi:nitroimidazol reductase NimA-like FMN-containing flavoprotein (pyridoxamine 5'-phosphate oxidase superfamily)